jgi:hypothetical protein
LAALITTSLPGAPPPGRAFRRFSDGQSPGIAFSIAAVDPDGEKHGVAIVLIRRPRPRASLGRGRDGEKRIFLSMICSASPWQVIPDLVGGKRCVVNARHPLQVRAPSCDELELVTRDKLARSTGH